MLRVIVGLDVGTKRIGVARSLEGSPLASGAGFVSRQGVKKDVAALARLFEAQGFEVLAVVVGLPLDEDGQEQRSTRLARQIAVAVEESLGLPVHLQDETYSTLEAERRLRGRGVGSPRWPELIDAEAAAVILEDWLEQGGTSTPA